MSDIPLPTRCPLCDGALRGASITRDEGPVTMVVHCVACGELIVPPEALVSLLAVEPEARRRLGNRIAADRVMGRQGPLVLSPDDFYPSPVA